MRRALIVVPLMVLLSCASLSHKQQVNAFDAVELAKKAYVDNQERAVQLHEDGVMSDLQYNHYVVPLDQKIHGMLMRAYANLRLYVALGSPEDLNSFLKILHQVNGLLADYTEMLDTIEHLKDKEAA